MLSSRTQNRPSGAAHHVDSGHVDAHPVRRFDPERRPVELRDVVTSRRGTTPSSRIWPRPYTSARKASSALTRWATPGRKDRPLLLGDDPRYQVERERPLLARQLERDAPVAEAPVPGRAAGLEVVGRQGLQRVVEGPGGRAGHAGRLEHLVPRPDPEDVGWGVAVEEVAHRVLPV